MKDIKPQKKQYRMLRSKLYIFVIALLALWSCDDFELKEWYYDEPPLPPYANFFGSESLNVGIDTTSMFFVKLKGEKPLTLEYTNGIDNFVLDDIQHDLCTIYVNPAFTTNYAPISISNELSSEGFIEGEATVWVFSEKQTISTTAEGYLHKNNNEFKAANGSGQIELKDKADSYIRRAFFGFSFPGDADFDETDQVFLNFSFVRTYHTDKALSGGLKIELMQGNLDTEMTWDNQPDAGFQQIEIVPFDVSGGLPYLVSVNVTDKVREALDAGENNFFFRVQETNVVNNVFYIGGSGDSNLDNRPSLKIKGPIYEQ